MKKADTVFLFLETYDIVVLLSVFSLFIPLSMVGKIIATAKVCPFPWASKVAVMPLEARSILTR